MNQHPLRIVSTGHRALLAKAYHWADNVFTEIAANDLKVISINEHVYITPNPIDNGEYFTVILSILVENDENAKAFAQYHKARSFGMALYFGNESPLDITNYRRDAI